MDQVHISVLNPEQPGRESTYFRATVTLIWPYSSSARQFALLLSEPDVRLRRKNGQVRARFAAASAKAMATTGVGIGDEVILSLRGAQFIKEGAVHTPGKSIEWELSYTHTAVAHVFRDGSEIAHLDVVDAAPTPAPPSPGRGESSVTPSRAHEYASPAFLKHARLAGGPVFQVPHDPLAHEYDKENEQGHAKKRRRKSYRDWKAWTYSARTPSPEKEDDSVEDALGSEETSPSRATQFPRTPVSPPDPGSLFVAAGPLHDLSSEQPAPSTSPKETALAVDDELVRDADYYELYAGPDEVPLSDAQYAFGGDTEVDTEVNTEEDEEPMQGGPDVVSTGTTEADPEEQEHSQLQRTEDDMTQVESVASQDELVSNRGDSGAPRISMPPPTLSALQTDLPTSVVQGVLTPIGREPASPTLRPQDSATLPLPSPFPGERDVNATSYFGHATTTPQHALPEVEVEEAQELPAEASYIGETSFFSSIGSLKASAFHPNHESAFTPVRFTFGMDGAGFSRPLDVSSPEPEAQSDKEQPASTTDGEIHTTPPHEGLVHEVADDHIHGTAIAASQSSVEEATEEPDVLVLSSGSESEQGERSEAGDNILNRNEQDLGLSPVDETKQNLEAAEDMHPAAGEPQDDDSTDIEMRDDDQQPNTSTRKSPFPNDQPRTVPHSQEEDRSPSVNLDSHSEFVNLEFAAEGSNTMKAPEERTATHTTSQETGINVDFPKVEQTASIEEYATQPALDSSHDYLHDAFPTEHFSQTPEWEQLGEQEHHPDIKMESIEEDSLFPVDESNRRVSREIRTKRTTESLGELMIAVPEDGHKLGELHTISVPATGPARNTRSKTKTSMSPTKEETPLPKRTTRSTRSKVSMTPIPHTAISPPRRRTRSAMSPSQDATQTSPYALRSQSKLLSPTQSASATTRTSSRKLAFHRNIDSISDAGPSQPEDLDPFLTNLVPSQEPGVSQGRYSDVAFVKDSEESVRSEHSLSTVYFSDDWPVAGEPYTSYSDPLERAGSQYPDKTGVRPPPGTAPELRRRPSARTGWKKTDPQVVIEVRSSSPARPNFSFITQPKTSSPGRRLRSAGSTEAASRTASPSPRNVRSARRHVYEPSPEVEEGMGELSDEGTPKAGYQPIDHVLSGEEQDSYSLLQPGATGIDELMRSSPPTDVHTYSRANLHSVINSNRPITPEATQPTKIESQPRLSPERQGESSLLTPQPTQTTSVGLRSSQADMETYTEATTVKTIPKTSPITRSIHGRNVTSVSPTLAGSSSPMIPDAAEQPSIGFSTPLAYYTPLKDLVYFLNRSSQFHSATNPDLLALVTSSSTAAEKAKKGPKHWTTTLHITDASTWPSTSTVQIFRAYHSALPEAEVGDVVLLRAFAVKSLNRQSMLVSGDESAWCVWRWGKPVWGARRGAFGELRAREQVNGPAVERGEGEWSEVEKLRRWYTGRVKGEMLEREDNQAKTRNREVVQDGAEGVDEGKGKRQNAR